MRDLFIELHTERLRLSPVSRRDAVNMYQGLQASALYRFIPGEPPKSLEALANRYGSLESGLSPDGREHWVNWLAHDASFGSPLGFVQATVPIEDNSICTVAYVFFEEFWGQGYAREALKEMIRHLAVTARCHSFKALIDSRNLRSIGVVESLGFSLVATHLAADFFKGSQSDEFEYSLDSRSVA